MSLRIGWDLQKQKTFFRIILQDGLKPRGQIGGQRKNKFNKERLPVWQHLKTLEAFRDRYVFSLRKARGADFGNMNSSLSSSVVSLSSLLQILCCLILIGLPFLLVLYSLLGSAFLLMRAFCHVNNNLSNIPMVNNASYKAVSQNIPQYKPMVQEGEWRICAN